MNVTHQTGAFQVREGWDSKVRRRFYFVVEVDADSLRVWQERQERVRCNGHKTYDDRHYIQAKRTVERFNHDPNGHAWARERCDELAGGES